MKSQELLDRRVSETSEHISEAGLRASSAKLLPAGTVLLAMYGANVGQLGYLDIDATVNQAICALVTDPTRTSSRFLYYALMLARDDLITRAQGAAQQNLSQQVIKPFSIRVPTIAVQQRIAGVLGALDDLIENNRRRVEVLEKMARSIYRAWFVHFRYPDHEQATFDDSLQGAVPTGWSVQSFAELASFVNGFAFKPADWGRSGRPIVKIKELKGGVTADTPRCDEAAVGNRYRVEPGDLLFSWSADLGVYLWPEEPSLLNQHLFLVHPAAPMTKTFLYHSLAAAMPEFWRRAQGTTMRHIKRSALTEVTALVPDHELLARFSAMVEPLDRQVLLLRATQRRVAAIRDLLLPKLVSGEIDVSSLDLDALVEESVA